MPRPNLPHSSAEVLSATVALLMVIQSATGLGYPSIYRDVAWIRAAWFGNDLVSLFVAVPLLATGMLLARRGSRRGTLLWTAALAYAIYNYGFYLFGARINAFFPVYVLILVLSAIALILVLVRLDVADVAAAFRPTTPVRWISGYMLLTGLALTIAWTAQWAAFMLTGVEPAIGEEAFRLIAAMDLSLVVPGSLLGGALLWRRRPWGFVMGGIVILKGATYTLVLAVASTVGAARGLEGSAAQIPLWTGWTVLGLAALALLLGNLQEAPRRKAEASGGAFARSQDQSR